MSRNSNDSGPRSVLRIMNAKLRFRNFSGKEGQFNPKGQRNFAVLLEPEHAKQLISDGWNVKFLKPRDPEDPEQPYLPVKVDYSHVPPEIYLVTKQGKTLLEEKSIGILDWAEIENVDLRISPYSWTYNGKTGVKAYLKSAHVTIVEDEISEKYRDVPDSAASAMLNSKDALPWEE